MLWDYCERFFDQYPQNAITQIDVGVIIRVYIPSLGEVHPLFKNVGFKAGYYFCTIPKEREIISIPSGAFEGFILKYPFPKGSISSSHTAKVLSNLSLGNSTYGTFPRNVNILRRMERLRPTNNAPASVYARTRYNELFFSLCVQSNGDVYFSLGEREIEEEDYCEEISPRLQQYILPQVRGGSFTFFQPKNPMVNCATAN